MQNPLEYYPQKLKNDYVHYRLRKDGAVEKLSIFGGGAGGWREVKERALIKRLCAINNIKEVKLNV